MESFELALAQGADAIELDLRVTADGEVVIIHDPTTGRTGDHDLTVAEVGWSRLREVDVAAESKRKGLWQDRASVPRLTEVMARLAGVPLLVEIKETTDAGTILELLSKTPHARRLIVVGSFHHGVLRVFGNSGFALSASRRQTALFVASRRPDWSGRPRFQALSIPPRWHGLQLATRRLCSAATRHGVAVHVWTVNEPTEAVTLWRRGVTGIITDLPQTMVAARNGIDDG